MKNSTKVALIGVTVIMIAANLYISNNETNFPNSNTTETATVTKDKPDEGEALIGGEFELTDQNGNKFTEQNLKGKYSLVYFGFTNCPMICPTALSSISLAIDKLGDKAKDIQPVFITTDPERDDQARLSEFLKNFDPSILGLTGTQDQIDKAKQAYRVYAEKIAEKDPAKYDMNHSSIIYIMDKDGKYKDHFTHETPVDDIVKKLSELN